MTFGPFDLTGKVVLVTGGNSGVGLGMATGLAQAGADVCVWGRSTEKNDSAHRSLSAFGRRVMVDQVDIEDPDQISAAFDRFVAKLGRVDACFANAGIGSTTDAPRFVDSTLETWQKTQRVNLDGTYLTLRAAARTMVEQGDGGSLVATSSIAARFGSARNATYSASKSGIEALMRGLAVELGRHRIRANSLEPAWTLSEHMTDYAGSDLVKQKVMPRIPLRRFGTPADWAGVAVYLASDASSFHTGDVLRIDGGYSIF